MTYVFSRSRTEGVPKTRRLLRLKRLCQCNIRALGRGRVIARDRAPWPGRSAEIEPNRADRNPTIPAEPPAALARARCPAELSVRCSESAASQREPVRSHERRRHRRADDRSGARYRRLAERRPLVRVRDGRKEGEFVHTRIRSSAMSNGLPVSSLAIRSLNSGRRTRRETTSRMYASRSSFRPR